MSVEPQTSTWIIVGAGLSEVKALVLGFGPVRTEIHSVTLHPLASEVDPIVSPGAHHHTYEVTALPERITREDHFIARLEVRYAENAPQLVLAYWETTSARKPKTVSLALPLGALLEVDRPMRANFLWRTLLRQRAVAIGLADRDGIDFALEPLALTAEQTLLHRKLTMRKDEAARRFFLELDLATHSDGVSGDLRDAFSSVNLHLADRVLDRAGLGSQRPAHVPHWERSERLGERLRAVSSFMQTMVQVHLSLESSCDTFGWALRRFVVDSLAVNDPDNDSLASHGAPDSIAFFRIAELALACIDYEIDASFWVTHLRSLVVASHAYAEHGGERVDRTLHYAYREGRRFPKTRWKEIMSQYPAGDTTSDLEERFSRVVSAVVPGKIGFMTHKGRALTKKVSLVHQDDAPELMQAVELIASEGFLRSLKKDVSVH